MKTVKITIKGLNYYLSVYMYRKIKMLRCRLQVMINTADHYQQIIIDLQNTNNELRNEIGRLNDYNLNSRKKRRNAIKRKIRRYANFH